MRAGDKAYTLFITMIVIVFAVFCFLPFWLIVFNSITDNTVLNQKGYQLLHFEKFSLDAYRYLLKGKQVYTSYAVSLFQTGVGTLLAVLISSMYAYVLSHRKVKFANFLAFMTYFTMIFGSGLVGFYLLISKWLNLKDDLWALVLPYLLDPFLVFIMISFFRSIPYELYESATIDGANDYRIFFRIILPVSKPIIATISLFYALKYWNDWFLSLLFIDDSSKHSLQMMLRQLISTINASQYVSGSAAYIVSMPTEGIKLATVCITIGPIILLYPFVQRYFVKGLTIGAVKG